MPTISVVTDPREPNTFQVWAQGCDASLAAITGSTTSSLWLNRAEAEQLQRQLGEKLDQTATEGNQP